MKMFIDILLLLIGFAVLGKSADFFVSGASNFSKKLGISELIIGLTVVSIGTSLPELFINIKAVLVGSTDFAIANIIGSNMANILLIMGFMLLLGSDIIINKKIRNNIYISVFFAFLLLLLGNINIDDIFGISKISGAILIFATLIYGIYTYFQDKKDELPTNNQEKYSNFYNILMILGGIIGLIIGGNIVVDGALGLSVFLGLSEKVIGITVLAVGTSLPELTTSIIAIKKHKQDIAVGNIIGSNIINIGLILGITSTLGNLPFYDSINLDILIIIFSSLFICLLSIINKNVGKYTGILLLIIYIFYITYNILYNL